MTDKKDKIQQKKRNDHENDHENDLWRIVTKDVTPLVDRYSRRDNSHDHIKDIKENTPTVQYSFDETYTPKANQHHHIDTRTAQRLRRGQMTIDGRIDLHGMTQNQAYDLLCHAIPNAYHHGKRCVLVITGKGGNRYDNKSLLYKTIGVLKQKTPEWLADNPLKPYVLQVEKARPHHGGDGALYVLIRRKR